MSLKDYIPLQKLGVGTFGKVQKVIKISTSQQYALKTVKYLNLKEKDKKNALNQICILSSINHPNIIKYSQAFFQENNRYLCTVMEFASGGDLAFRIKEKIKNNQYFSEKQIWFIGRDILNGICALHQKNILHRDIKPANIFFCEGNVAKIGDFNVSLLLQDNFASTQIGTPYYASPQVWSNQPYAYQCDIWSFGCVVYEMCSLRKPFQEKNIEKLYQKIRELKFESIPCQFSYHLMNVIQQCLTYRKYRISLEELKRIFEMRISQYYDRNNQVNESLKSSVDSAKIPSSKRTFGQYISKPLIENPEEKSLPQTQAGIKESRSILDRFLIPQKRLPVKKQYSNKLLKSQNILSNKQKYISSIDRLPLRNEPYLKSSAKSIKLLGSKQFNLKLTNNGYI